MAGQPKNRTQIPSCHITGKVRKKLVLTVRYTSKNGLQYTHLNSQSSILLPIVALPVLLLFISGTSALSVRVMLYQLYEDMTQENLDKLKFLLSNKLGRRQTELCKVRTNSPNSLLPTVIQALLYNFFYNFVYKISSSKSLNCPVCDDRTKRISPTLLVDLPKYISSKASTHSSKLVFSSDCTGCVH